MSDSSSLSEVTEPQSSDSLDTMLGLSTETGRETAVTPTSSSGTQALTDPTLTSSDSSQPAIPRQEGRGRLQDDNPSGDLLAPPSNGSPAEQNSAAAASRPAAARHTTVSGQQHPAHNIGTAPAGSVVSSVTSRHGISVSNLPRKLLKCVTEMRNTENMGEREIAYGQKEMSQLADKIRTKLDSVEELEPSFMAVIKSVLDQSDKLAKEAMKRLDKLSKE